MYIVYTMRLTQTEKRSDLQAHLHPIQLMTQNNPLYVLKSKNVHTHTHTHTLSHCLHYSLSLSLKSRLYPYSDIWVLSKSISKYLFQFASNVKLMMRRQT